MSNRKPKVMLLFHDKLLESLNLDYEWIICHPEDFDWHSTFGNYSKEHSTGRNIEDLIKSVQNTLEVHPDIEGVILTYDMVTVLLTAVLSQYKNLKVKFPSYESVFLCSHKYYGRTMESDPVGFSYIDVFSDKWEKNLPQQYPFFFKPTELSMSLHQYIIKDKEQVKSLIPILRKELPNFEGVWKYIHKKYLDLEKYPLGDKSIMLCEELIELTDTQINWEGWADDEGNLFTYTVVDENMADTGIFSDFITPSRFSSEILDRVEKICFDFLKSINWRSSFANIELWLLKNGDIKIIEVNPRSAYPNYLQYVDAYGRNLYEDMIKVSMGRRLQNVPSQTNFKAYSCQTVLATRLNGKVAELLDFGRIEEEKRNNPSYQFCLLQQPDIEIENNNQNGGRVLMRVFFTKLTYEAAEAESLRLKKAILVRDTYYLRN